VLSSTAVATPPQERQQAFTIVTLVLFRLFAQPSCLAGGDATRSAKGDALLRHHALEAPGLPQQVTHNQKQIRVRRAVLDLQVGELFRGSSQSVTRRQRGRPQGALCDLAA